MTLDALAVVSFVVDTSMRALGAALAVALVLRLLRVRAAAVLHRAWSAVVLAMLLMPVLPRLVPAVPVPVPAAAGDFLGSLSITEKPSKSVVRHSTQSRTTINGDSTAQEPSPTPTSGRAPAAGNGARPSGSWLLLVSFMVYIVGVLLFGVRLWYGWIVASTVVRRAKGRGPVLDYVRLGVYESSDVTVPMTVGVVRPVIILPTVWKAWDPQTLTAIIAHEASHIRRGDAWMNFAAHLNRGIFWFHPLAWWLERKLALTAEHVCDETAARAIAAPDRYAEILVEMADVVRRNRGRLAWHSLGVCGNGLLDSRLERLLRGDAFADSSRRTKIGAVIGCILAIVTAIACRQQIPAPSLREDPELAEKLVNHRRDWTLFEAARDMTQQQADALEQRIDGNPEDFEARRQLVTYYRTSSKVAWDKKVPGLRRHALWLIEHHPEHDLQPPALSPQFDPEGFSAAKSLWQAQLVRPDASPFLVFRAASFFAPYDKPYAEQLILRGMAMDPASLALKARMPTDVGAYQWPVQLSSLYGAALRGSESAWGTYNDLRSHLEQINSSYAKEVRAKLDVATDAQLLARVGGILTRPNQVIMDPALKDALDEVHALGVRYLKRALELDRNLQTAKATIVNINLTMQATEADRLAHRALEHYLAAEDITEYAKKDIATAQRQRDEATTLAEETLNVAAAHAQDPAYSAAIMTAHHVLAIDALRNGDRLGAVQHMRESIKVPTSERIQYAPPFSWSRPVNRLLKAGEREAVVDFLEGLAQLTIKDRDRLQQDAKAVREGRMPSSYQHEIARQEK